MKMKIVFILDMKESVSKIATTRPPKSHRFHLSGKIQGEMLLQGYIQLQLIGRKICDTFLNFFTSFPWAFPCHICMKTIEFSTIHLDFLI